MIALTVVLLIWSARVVFTGMDVSFNQLSGIASSYVIVGIWLHIMVHKHMSKMALFYKKVYPFSALLVLVFEAWALVVQLSKFGLKTAEYSFGMLWIFTLISVLLLIVLKDRAYRKIAITAIIISIIWVLPFIGYQDITFNSQVARLEERLIREGLLVAGDIVKADEEVEREVKGKITDGVDFISRSEKTNTPAWFKDDLIDGEVFKNTFGFEKTYGIYPEMSDYKATGLMLKIDYIDISDYDLSLNLERKDKFENSVEFEGKDGNYQITWTDISRDNYKISVKLDGEIIIEEELDEYLSNLVDKYPPQVDGQKELGLEEMSVLLESDSISLLLVFDNINIYFDEVEDKVDYYTNIQGIYLKYK